MERSCSKRLSPRLMAAIGGLSLVVGGCAQAKYEHSEVASVMVGTTDVGLLGREISVEVSRSGCDRKTPISSEQRYATAAVELALQADTATLKNSNIGGVDCARVTVELPQTITFTVDPLVRALQTTFGIGPDTDTPLYTQDSKEFGVYHSTSGESTQLTPLEIVN